MDLRLITLLSGLFIGVMRPISSLDTPVIQGPSKVIYRPNEPPIELTCIRNTTVGFTGWRVNGSDPPYPLPLIRNGGLPGHAVNATNDNLIIVNATNNTEYVCVSVTDDGATNSAPVHLYITGVAVIEGPVEVIYRPGDDPVELTCTIYEGAAGWSVNGENPVTATAIRNGGLDNHTVSGTNLVVLVPTNNTQYVCVAIRDGGDFYSNPVYLYIAAAPDMIGTVKIDTKTVRAVARRHYNFTVIWNEPFANFDPIVNYTVNIGCTNAATCPVIVNTNNATRADVSVITNLAASYKITTLSVTATNTIGTSDPAISVIGVAPSITEAMTTLVTPNEIRTNHSITVTCTVRPESDADMCVVMAMADGRTTREGMAAVTNGTATVTVDGLECEITYTVIAGGTLNGALVGPRSSHGTITSGPCPPLMPTPSVATPSMNATSSSLRLISTGVSPATSSSIVPVPTGGSPATSSSIVPVPTGGPSATSSSIVPVPTGGPPDAPNYDNDDDKDDYNNTGASSGASTGAIVGGAVGGLAGAVLLILPIILLWFYLIRRRREKSSIPSSDPESMINLPLYDTVQDPA